MKNKINKITGMGMALGLTALMALTPGPASAHPGNGGGGGHNGGGGGKFYATVSTARELIVDINYANTAGGAVTINLAPGTTFDLTDATDGNYLLPVIATGVDLTILGNGDTLNRVDTYAVDVDGTRYVSNPYGLFAVASGGALTLEDLTLNNAFSGVDNQGTLTLVGVTLTSNYPGINNDTSGMVTITDSTLSNNSRAIDNAAGGMVTITDSTLSNNGADYGGAIYNDIGTLTVNNSVLSGNSAWFGGAIYINGGTVMVNDSTLTNNTAIYFTYEFDVGGYGGGIFNAGGTLTVSGSIMTSNEADRSGGGLFNLGTTTVENSSTITNNSCEPYYNVDNDVDNEGALSTDGTCDLGVFVGNDPIVF